MGILVFVFYVTIYIYIYYSLLYSLFYSFFYTKSHGIRAITTLILLAASDYPNLLLHYIYIFFSYLFPLICSSDCGILKKMGFMAMNGGRWCRYHCHQGCDAIIITAIKFLNVGHWGVIDSIVAAWGLSSSLKKKKN
jgi:hypothetical protein